MTDANEIAAYYQCLNLPVNASLAAVDQAYFSLRAEKIQAGDRQAIVPLREAREKIKSYLETAVKQSATGSDSGMSQSPGAPISPIENLVAALAGHNLSARASVREQVLNLGISADTRTPSQVTAHVLKLLSDEAALAGYGIDNVGTIKIYGLGDNNQAVWKKTLSLSESKSKNGTVLRRFG